MKKWIALLLLVFVLAIGFLYFVFPNKVLLKENMPIAANRVAFSRAFQDIGSWQHWWPQEKGQSSAVPTAFFFHGNEFTVVEKKYASLLLSIKHEQDSVLTEMVIIPLPGNAVEVHWYGTLPIPPNPIARIRINKWAKQLAADLRILLQKMQQHYTNPDHLYGFPIRVEQIKDSTLISTFATLKNHPNTEEVYSMIDKLKAFAQKHNARQTGFPMLHITANADSTYLTRVALPVDKKLKDVGNIQYRWMLGGGNILATEVKGGQATIAAAFSALDQYMNDHHRIAPAIPFQSLRTNRRAEPDTSKWVTKLYWPIM